MSRRLYENIEGILQRYHSSYLKVLEKQYSIEMHIFKQEQNVHSSVYGGDSGEVQNEGIPFMGIATGDDFFPTSGKSSGSFEEGWLYTSSDIPEKGDFISIKPSDEKSRRYEIESREAIGTQTDVFHKFRLSAIGD